MKKKEINNKEVLEIDNVSELNIGDMFTPNSDMILLELQRESSEYTPGISRLNPEIEVYCKVVSVGESSIPYMAKSGDYVIQNPGVQINRFKLEEKEYWLTYKHNVWAKIDEHLVPLFKTSNAKKVDNNTLVN